MDNGNMITVDEPNTALSITQQQRAALTNAAALAQDVAKIVKENGLAKKFGGSAKEHVFLEGWLTISRVNNEAPHAEVKDIIRDAENGSETIRARAWITDARGSVVSEADGYCSTEESNWKGKPFYARASMAQTRAIGKAMRLRHAWVMVMAGFEACPVEEMEGVAEAAPPPAPTGKKEYKVSKPKQEAPPADDAVPKSVTDASAPNEPLVVADSGLESVVLKAYSKEKTDKAGRAYRGILLVHSDNSEKWWNLYHAESIAQLQPLKGKMIEAKLEMKGEYPLCHKIEVTL